jgi:hypothetical protein
MEGRPGIGYAERPVCDLEDKEHVPAGNRTGKI